MSSRSTREIVGELRFALGSQLRQQYPELDGKQGFVHADHPYPIKTILNVEWKELTADYYIGPGDGAGPIMVEVGEPNEEKWMAIQAKDGRPVRVLTVSDRGEIRLANSRHTQFEEDLMSLVQATMVRVS